MNIMTGDKESKQRASYMATAGVMLALIIFAFCSVSMLLYSASSSRKAASRSEVLWESRTCWQYLEQRVRQMDAAGCIYTGLIEDKDALVLKEFIDGEEYATWIYCSDGWLREYFTEESVKPDAASGTKFLEADRMSILREGNLLTVKTDLPGGVQVCVDICVNSGEILSGEERQ